MKRNINNICGPGSNEPGPQCEKENQQWQSLFSLKNIGNLELQRKYEDGLIDEDDMTLEEVDLYIEHHSMEALLWELPMQLPPLET